MKSERKPRVGLEAAEPYDFWARLHFLAFFLGFLRNRKLSQMLACLKTIHHSLARFRFDRNLIR